MKVLALSALAALAFAPAVAQAPAAPQLSFPLACQPGRTCEIQHYVDRLAGPGTRDYRCGLQTYEGHDGVDIRVPDMAAERRGVDVLAAAAGTVARLRDGVQDISIRAPGAPSTKGQECGNGVVIDHGGGWETQYCHLAKGSVRVKVGDKVAAGTPIAKVGLSGDTEFPHLHLTVRRGGKAVDPFAPDPAAPCGGGAGLWTAQARAMMPYRAGVVLNAGFTEGQFTMDELENGGLKPATAQSPWLVAYVRAIALLPGDRVELELKAPNGAVLAKSERPALERWRAQDLVLVGKRRPPAGWPAGAYAADYRVWRQGKVAISRRIEVRF